MAIDLIGPWQLKVNGRLIDFNALTCIDTASNLVELIRIDIKTSNHIKHKFIQYWLVIYLLGVFSAVSGFILRLLHTL